tara:strand:+ start:468 stop:1400 length:933 start_codon:yes stop_codon:yes gene_type:complete
MARYGNYDPSEMLGLLNMAKIRNTQMPNLNIRGGYESGFSPQKVDIGEQLPIRNPMIYNSYFRANRGEAPPVPPQVGIDDDMGGFGPDSLIDYIGEAPGTGARAGMPVADNTAIQQKYAGIRDDMMNQSPFSNMEFRRPPAENLMDMVEKVPKRKSLPTDLAGSTDYVKGIIDKGFDKWSQQGSALAKTIDPKVGENKFSDLDQGASPNLRQMARTIDVSDPESVRAFQKAAGLKVDGIFGPKSHAKLREIQGLADDYDKYKNPSLMNYAQNNNPDKESPEKNLTKNKEITDKNVSIDEIDTSAPYQISF